MQSFLDEAVAHATDGVEVTGRRTKFLAEASHVGIDGAAVDGGVVFPHVAQKQFARNLVLRPVTSTPSAALATASSRNDSMVSNVS